MVTTRYAIPEPSRTHSTRARLGAPDAKQALSLFHGQDQATPKTTIDDEKLNSQRNSRFSLRARARSFRRAGRHTANVKKWVRAADRVENGKENRGYFETKAELARINFSVLNKSSAHELNVAFEKFRPELATKLREAINEGVEWHNIVLQLSQAASKAKDKDGKPAPNAQVSST